MSKDISDQELIDEVKTDGLEPEGVSTPDTDWVSTPDTEPEIPDGYQPAVDDFGAQYLEPIKEPVFIRAEVIADQGVRLTFHPNINPIQLFGIAELLKHEATKMLLDQEMRRMQEAQDTARIMQGLRRH